MFSKSAALLPNQTCNTSLKNVESVKFQWQINNFSLINQGTFTSCDFYCQSSKTIKWNLQLNPAVKLPASPSESEADDGNRVRLRLQMSPSSMNGDLWHISGTLSLPHGNFKAKRTNFQKICGAFGSNDIFSDMVIITTDELRSLMVEGTNPLPSDTLTISCEITLSSMSTEPTSVNTFMEKKTLEDIFLDATFKDKWTDVTLKAKGSEVKAHKIILAAKSTFFLAMFQSNMKESLTGVVEIGDIEFPVLEELIRYMYLGKSDKLSSMSNDLLAAAEKFGVDDLKQLCVIELLKNITDETVMTIWTLGHMHLSTLLKQAAVKYIRKHYKRMSCHKNWEKFIKENSLFLIELQVELAETLATTQPENSK